MIPAAQQRRAVRKIGGVAIGCALACVPAQAQAQSPARERAAVERTVIRTHTATFDPLRDGAPTWPAALRPTADSRLCIVQFVAPSRAAWRTALRGQGARVVGFLHDQSHLVRLDPGVLRSDLEQLAWVRWVGDYAPGFRVPPAVAERCQVPRLEAAPELYAALLVDKVHDREPLEAAVAQLGGTVLDPGQPGVRISLRLTDRQLAAVVRRDEVLWIQPDLGTATDAHRVDVAALRPMDNARVQLGADGVEQHAGLTGQGVTGHVYEGLEAGHSDFTFTPTPICDGTVATHGHAVAGIAFGNGSSVPQARGVLPDAQCLYTDHQRCGLSRDAVYAAVVQQAGMFSVTSWGSFVRTTVYDADSAAVDDAIFAHDLPVTQSQSNSGTQSSRAQAWAKNVLSVGGIHHGQNADPLDDSWFLGGASTGPAADGRIKPDLVGYIDSVLCSDRTGAAGYTPLDYNPLFGGTSAGSPMVAGVMGLALQMFTDGEFGNAVAFPGGTRFQNRPHAATAKALAIHAGQQYAFGPASTDNRREHQGWGLPSALALWQARATTWVVDETDALMQGEVAAYRVDVLPGTPELRLTMCYLDPMANPTSSITRINDLDLVVTAPDGRVFFGNAGLRSGPVSTAGGSPDDRDTVECIRLPSPAVGTWSVEVVARAVNADARPETPHLDDVDFGLVVTGGLRPACAGTVAATGVGCGAGPGTPHMRFLGAPCVGRRVSLGIVGAAPTGAYALLLGTDATHLPGGTPLPIDLTPVGMPGCALGLEVILAPSIPVALPGLPAASVAALLDVPGDPGLIGQTWRVQGAFLDPGLNALGVGLTDLLSLTWR